MNRKRKILCMIDILVSGGAQRQLVELALGYKERGFEVAFLIYYKAFDCYYNATLEKAGIPIMDIDEPNYLKRIIRMSRMIRKYRPDAIISFLEVPNFIAEMASVLPHSWKLIVGERSADPEKLTNKRTRFFIHCHRFADAVVANSHANLEIVRQVAPELKRAKQHVIYNSLDPQKFTIDNSFVFCAHPRKSILIASSHRYLKNLDGLIEGVRLLPKTLQDQLIIHWYGHNKFNDTDHSFEEAQQKIAEYGLQANFAFYPPTLDIYDKMRESDAVGLFSHFEGLPNAICEGMFLAKPVVCTRISDLPLILEEDVNAFLCDSHDPETIMQALQRFLTAEPQQLEKMGNNNRRLAQQLFDKNTVLDQYQQLFES